MPVGGGVDDEMRVVARHLGQFIPGKPSVIARNMPGAGGVVLGNYLRHNAPADGLTLGMPTRSGFLLSNVVTQSGIKYDLADFSYIGGAGSNSVTLWLRKTGHHQYRGPAQLRRKISWLAGSAPRSQRAIHASLRNTKAGRFKVVHGYPGFDEVLIAIERGEVDGLMTAGQISRPDMITSGFLIAIFQSINDVPGLPLLSDHVTDPNAEGAAGTFPDAEPDRPTAMGPPRCQLIVSIFCGGPI